MHKYTAVISSEAQKAADALKERFDILSLPADDLLDRPVSCHADMILFTLGNTAVLPEAYLKKYPHIADILSYVMSLDVISEGCVRGSDYPRDISLNVLLCNTCAFSLEAHTSERVKAILKANGIRLINVRQGYAACSTLNLGDAVITADAGIAKAAQTAGLEALLISAGGISLDGYNEGFIGGASGVCGREVYFLGNIDSHPDGKKIRSFTESRGFKCISLWDGELCDFGGIRFIENKPHTSESIAVQLP